MAEQDNHFDTEEDAVVVVHGDASVHEDDNNSMDFSLSERSTRDLLQELTADMANSNSKHNKNLTASMITLKPESNTKPPRKTDFIIGNIAHSSIQTKSSKMTQRTTSQSDSIPSNTNSSATGGQRIRSGSLWTKLGRQSSGWDTMSDLNNGECDDNNEQGRPLAYMKSCCVNYTQSRYRWLVSVFKTVISTPSIIVICLVLFASLVTCGLLVIRGFEHAESDSRKQTARSVAEQTDLFFVRVLEKAFVPLFTMAQFVRELPEFHMLDIMVGDACDPARLTGSGEYENCTNASLESGMAPPLGGKEDSHRNLTRLFDSEYGRTINETFERIAAGIKANSGLGKSLVNIQLAPKGVLTNMYPMVNCQDFEDIGQPCLDNSGAWGLDLMRDGYSQNTAFATVMAEEGKPVTAGPLNLIQGTNAFIAQFPINFDGRLGDGENILEYGQSSHHHHSMVVDGVDYPCWGFASVLLNWERLKEESNIYKEFELERMQFKLTRTDVSATDGRETIVTIAESANSKLISNDNITLALNTGNNGWVIAVGYDDGFAPNYKIWAYPILVCSAFAFAVLLMLVLVSKTQHERLLLNLMPARAIRKLRKGQTVVERYAMVTIFFSDIVGYTNMSSEMTPIEVMTMLNSLYSQLDALAKKHDVFKVETIGDAYIAVAGAPNECSGPRAAEKMTLFALDALQTVRDFHTEDGARIAIRAGLASGPVVAGVVGSSLPKYTLFGDTVNFAARMEQTSRKMELQISPVTHRMLLDAPNYHFEREERYGDDGELGVMVKGKGRQYTYWVTGASELSSHGNGKDPALPTVGLRPGPTENADDGHVKAETMDANQVIAQDDQV